MANDLVDLERRLNDTVDRLANKFDKLQDTVIDIRERLVRMEASSVQHIVDDLQKEICSLRDKVSLLEQNDTAAAAGRKTLTAAAEWTHKLSPWIFAVALVAFNYFNR